MDETSRARVKAKNEAKVTSLAKHSKWKEAIAQSAGNHVARGIGVLEGKALALRKWG